MDYNSPVHGAVYSVFSNGFPLCRKSDCSDVNLSVLCCVLMILPHVSSASAHASVLPSCAPLIFSWLLFSATHLQG